MRTGELKGDGDRMRKGTGLARNWDGDGTGGADRMATLAGMGLGWQWVKVEAGWRQRLDRNGVWTGWRCDGNSMRITDGDRMEQGLDRDGMKMGW